MYNGLKFKDADGVIRSVSAATPLPVAGGGGGSSGHTPADPAVITLLTDIKTLLQDIKTNTTAP